MKITLIRFLLKMLLRSPLESYKLKSSDGSKVLIFTCDDYLSSEATARVSETILKVFPPDSGIKVLVLEKGSTLHWL